LLKEFSKPIVTPYELAMALRHDDGAWEGRIELDFERVIEGAVQLSMRASPNGVAQVTEEGKSKSREGV
jgi:hypothetical protein